MLKPFFAALIFIVGTLFVPLVQGAAIEKKEGILFYEGGAYHLVSTDGRYQLNIRNFKPGNRLILARLVGKEVSVAATLDINTFHFADDQKRGISHISSKGTMIVAPASLSFSTSVQMVLEQDPQLQVHIGDDSLELELDGPLIKTSALQHFVDTNGIEGRYLVRGQISASGIFTPAYAAYLPVYYQRFQTLDPRAMRPSAVLVVGHLTQVRTSRSPVYELRTDANQVYRIQVQGYQRVARHFGEHVILETMYTDHGQLLLNPATRVKRADGQDQCEEVFEEIEEEDGIF